MDRKQFIELMEHLEAERIARGKRLRKIHPSKCDHLYQTIADMSDGYIRHSRHPDTERPYHEDIEYIEAVRRALRISNDIADDIGMLDIIDEFEQIIIDGMEFDDLPKEDIHALRHLGEANPRGALLTSFLLIKSRKTLRSQKLNEGQEISERLRNLEHKIDSPPDEKKVPSHVESTTTFQKEDRPRRRWFKGLGKIAQGTALTIADVGLASGLLVLPVDPATQTWGAIVSSVTGVGTALDGAGELRGE